MVNNPSNHWPTSFPSVQFQNSGRNYCASTPWLPRECKPDQWLSVWTQTEDLCRSRTTKNLPTFIQSYSQKESIIYSSYWTSLNHLAVYSTPSSSKKTFATERPNILVWEQNILVWELNTLVWELNIMVWKLNILVWELNILLWKLNILVWELNILV